MASLFAVRWASTTRIPVRAFAAMRAVGGDMTTPPPPAAFGDTPPMAGQGLAAVTRTESSSDRDIVGDDVVVLTDGDIVVSTVGDDVGGPMQ
jgi:hypothetical protein